MIELVEANWPVFLIVLLIGIAAAWFVFVGSRKTQVTRDESGEPDKPAARNQALIDSEPVVKRDPVPEPTPVVPVAPMGMAGAGPAVAAAAQEAAAEAQSRDDLTRIKGVGPKLATILHEKGVTSFEQIANWNDADIDAIDAKLGRFQGRIRRDDWPTQARFLASGDTAGYEAQFGKL
ncbi:helix-hairpin-helix domain-containing protein [Erythrobacter litoralis]|uniref:Uncharacterized protein n=1 Tax=Erythrobacter litoralis (strain HTCC2594) TaxID=314225 RepID=Q2N8R1_ERYLH|nr:helix-hairpin-helix domain-containing protein [Erythrobacter litoralis]ABC63930.1 hypothetical protein ELI_09190 [Erythrobacter litoralis HTCC2594]